MEWVSESDSMSDVLSVASVSFVIWLVIAAAFLTTFSSARTFVRVGISLSFPALEAYLSGLSLIRFHFTCFIVYGWEHGIQTSDSFS